jgi:hypothetical protein
MAVENPIVLLTVGFSFDINVTTSVGSRFPTEVGVLIAFRALIIAADVQRHFG